MSSANLNEVKINLENAIELARESNLLLDLEKVNSFLKEVTAVINLLYAYEAMTEARKAFLKAYGEASTYQDETDELIGLSTELGVANEQFWTASKAACESLLQEYVSRYANEVYKQAKTTGR